MLRLPSRRGVYLFPPSLLILCQSFGTSLNAQPSFMSFDGADSIKYSEENPVSPPDEDHATSRYLQLPRAEQIGATIFADSEMDNFGQLMAVSADGRFIAIGALLHSEYMNGTGIVRVMENQNNSWKRIGNDIATEGDGVSAVAISCDGSTIAYHSPRGGRSEQLVAPVYKLGDAWNRVGEIIPGSSSLLSSYDAATALSLSGDGTVVALGWFGHTDPSEVRIYKWINDVWQEMESIQAHWKNDVISNVALSEDGSVVAVGVPFGHRFGDYIMVLQWDGGGWIQLGNDIQLGNHLPGRVVPMDISSGGSILAVGGSTIDPQSVHIFELRNGDWQQLGQDITGKVSNDSFGYSVSISGDGSVVAIGAPDYSPDMYQSVGYVRVFRFDGRRWQQIYYDIDGEGPSDYFGTTVSMSKDGSTVAVGSRAIRFVRDDYKYGLIKVYNLGTSLSPPYVCIPSLTLGPTTSPVTTIQPTPFSDRTLGPTPFSDHSLGPTPSPPKGISGTQLTMVLVGGGLFGIIAVSVLAIVWKYTQSQHRRALSSTRQTMVERPANPTHINPVAEA